jgi:hypothetical protein
MTAPPPVRPPRPTRADRLHDHQTASPGEQGRRGQSLGRWRRSAQPPPSGGPPRSIPHQQQAHQQQPRLCCWSATGTTGEGAEVRRTRRAGPGRARPLRSGQYPTERGAAILVWPSGHAAATCAAVPGAGTDDRRGPGRRRGGRTGDRIPRSATTPRWRRKPASWTSRMPSTGAGAVTPIWGQSGCSTHRWGWQR